MEPIGRYDIIRELGRGGMATVYLGLDPRIKRQVAIKVLPRQFTHDPNFLRRFEQEGQTIAALEHPAIVPLYEFGEYNDAPFLVMRFMSGGSLYERMGKGLLPLEEISRIFTRLAPALDKAHYRGIIHRDLKPANVLFDEDDLPFLADFGIARLAEETHTMTVIGTPAYMSPEQVRGEQKLDWRSDIYAFGVMLFEMLTGRQPYEAETPSGQMFKHAMDPVPDPLVLNPYLPGGAQEVIDKAMAKDRQDRYQSAADLAAGIHGLVAGSAPAVPVLAPEALEGVDDPIPIVDVEAALAANEVDNESPVVEEVLAVEDLPPALETPNISDPAIEPRANSAVAETIIDTPPDLQPVSLPDNLLEKETPAGELSENVEPKGRRKLPAWVWWAGAAVLVALLVLGIFSILRGVGSPPGGVAAGTVWERPKDGMQMVYVPAGTFRMGSTVGEDDEKPVHTVTLDAFWIDQTEVSNAQYKKCVASGECTPSEFVNNTTYNGAGYPVVGVSWENADNYCRWAGGDLPTEAQWEYAARGPNGSTYPWGDEDPSCEQAQYLSCGGRTVAVGSFSKGASWVKALDMAGNVWEWVADYYENDYYSASPRENPQGPADGFSKVVRGGSWNTVDKLLRSANRLKYVPTISFSFVGFRCAWSP